MKRILLMLSLLLIMSCAGTAPPQDGSNAETFISKNFSRENHDRLIILPIQRYGKGVVKEFEYDYSISDKYSLEFMKLNFTILDRGQLNLMLNEKALDMAGFINQGDFRDLKELFNADMVLVGSSEVEWIPPRTLNFNGMESPQRGFYDLKSSSIRIIDTQTSEVLITSQTNNWYGSASTEIMLSIKSKLAEKGLLD